jgi:hypothetical protein
VLLTNNDDIGDHHRLVTLADHWRPKEDNDDPSVKLATHWRSKEDDGYKDKNESMVILFDNQ